MNGEEGEGLGKQTQRRETAGKRRRDKEQHTETKQGTQQKRHRGLGKFRRQESEKGHQAGQREASRLLQDGGNADPGRGELGGLSQKSMGTEEEGRRGRRGRGPLPRAAKSLHPDFAAA